MIKQVIFAKKMKRSAKTRDFLVFTELGLGIIRLFINNIFALIPILTW